MKTKTFDCVNMKREAAEKIYQQIKSMTLEEELRFWNSTTEDDVAALRQAKAEEANAPTYSLEQVEAMLSDASV
jgi:hypothetical protein